AVAPLSLHDALPIYLPEGAAGPAAPQGRHRPDGAGTPRSRDRQARPERAVAAGRPDRGRQADRPRLPGPQAERALLARARAGGAPDSPPARPAGYPQAP